MTSQRRVHRSTLVRVPYNCCSVPTARGNEFRVGGEADAGDRTRMPLEDTEPPLLSEVPNLDVLANRQCDARAVGCECSRHSLSIKAQRALSHRSPDRSGGDYSTLFVD